MFERNPYRDRNLATKAIVELALRRYSKYFTEP